MSKVVLSVLSDSDIKQIHEASLKLLYETGMEIEYEPAVECLKKAGMRVDGSRVYFDPSYVEKKVAEAPHEFTIYARDPQYNVHIGGDSLVFVSRYGAPFIMDAGGNRRLSTREDYMTLLKLVHSCPEGDRYERMHAG